jgi:hypothetical protein
MAYKIDVFTTEPMQERFEIESEGADFPIRGIVGIAMAPEIEGVNRSFLGQILGEVIPPMGVGAASVKQNKGCVGGCCRAHGAGMQAMKRYSITGFEANRLRFRGHCFAGPDHARLKAKDHRRA